MNGKIRLALLLWLALTALPGSEAASRDGEAARFYEDALKRFEQNDNAGAIVQLKNALQQEPGMLAARVLLGKAFLRERDPAAAEEELNRAMALGVDSSEIAVPLAQALRDQGKHKELLERFSPSGLSQAQQAELFVVRGQSYRALGDTQSAFASFEKAEAADPKNVAALLAQADLLGLQHKPAKANQLLDRALALSPNDGSAWRIKAGIAQASGDSSGALAAYAKTLALEPGLLDARIGRITLLLELNRDKEAEADIEELKRQNTKEPRAVYLRAVFLARKGDEAGARVALQEVTQAIDPASRTLLKQQGAALLLIGGLAHYGLNEAEKARSYFQDYLTVDPSHSGARKLLGSILLGQGDVKGAIATLALALRATPSDPQVLSMLAAAQMSQGDYRIATRYLEQALQSGGDNADVHSTLGFSLLGVGQRDMAFDHLRKAFDKDPAQFRTGAALAVMYLRRNQAKEAVAVAEIVAKRDPRNVSVLNLLGVAKAAAGDRAGAKAAYLQAIQADKRFTPAQLNLGKLELMDGNQTASRERFLAILKARPKDTQAMYELAELEAKVGNPAEAARWLEKAHAINRRDTRVTSRLVDMQILAGNSAAALSAAKDTESALPDKLDALLPLGRAYLAAGKVDLARKTFERMELLAGVDADWQYRIAGFQVGAGNLKGAARCLDKALSAQPEHVASQILMTEVEIQSGEWQKAERRAKEVLSRYPDRAIGKRLLADLALAKKDYSEAITMYRAALASEAYTEWAIRLYNAYVASGNTGKGTEYLEGWVREHPRDVVAVSALAEGYLRASNFPAARSWYERTLKASGEQPAILNNLANIAAKQGDPIAISYAERAYAVSPSDPAVLDTLGWILVQQKQPERALRYLREARLRGPQSDEIRYHLAVALSRTGRTAEAKTELDQVVASNAKFDGSDDARTLWLKLSTN